MMRAIQRRSAALAATALACAAGTAAGQYVKLVPADATAGALFGYSVWVGDDMLVGAPGYSGDIGAVYAFERTGGLWNEVAKLQASDGEEFDLFGCSICVDGDMAIIGANRAGNGPGSKAYVFQRLRSGWREIQRLDPSDGKDAFGTSVAIDGGRLLVGTSEADDMTGKVYVFELVAGEWVETAQLFAPEARVFDEFGSSLHLEGDLAIIGAPGRDLDAQENNEGAVFVYELAGGAWDLAATLMALDPGRSKYFGRSLAIDGGSMIVGSPGYAVLPGAAYVFERTADQWVQVAELTAPNGRDQDGFGNAVSIRGETALVGAPWRDDHGTWSGSSYVFQKGSDGVWSLLTKITPADNASMDYFGFSLALGADSMAIGAWGDDDFGSASGSLYVAEIPHERSPDFNGDGVVDTRDVIDFLDAWAQHEASSDWDWNWWFDTRDLIAFLNDWVAGG